MINFQGDAISTNQVMSCYVSVENFNGVQDPFYRHSNGWLPLCSQLKFLLVTGDLFFCFQFSMTG